MDESVDTGVAGASELVNESLIGASRWAESARRLVSEHAAYGKTVIFEGEPGTGRRFLASLIHRYSARREGPFITVGLGLATDELARRVLFGDAQTPFDDNARSEKGLVELAAGGTLYIEGLLDNSPGWIGDVARFIEGAGVNGDRDGSVRILLGSTIQSSRWRASISAGTSELSCERIQIPPLRERRDDIEALARHFIKQRCGQMGKEERDISPDVAVVLSSYDWPRNVAELRTVVNHLVRQSRPPSIDVSLLPAYIMGSGEAKNILAATGLDMDKEVKQFEMDLICSALRQSRGFQNKAAQLLGIRPTTLFMKIKRYGIEVADYK
jgi:two-component system response regulator AtoC